MLKNKLGFALTEGIMYQSADNTLDLRILNPAAIYHDYYIRGNSNSILSRELNYSPISYVNLYGQMVVDEFVLPGEPLPGETRAQSYYCYPYVFKHLRNFLYRRFYGLPIRMRCNCLQWQYRIQAVRQMVCLNESLLYGTWNPRQVDALD
ncbi:MAG TPA: hypothetical protein PKX66_08740 [Rectinema sp.]|nr:hypothetical protein [Rectinema sp.]